MAVTEEVKVAEKTAHPEDSDIRKASVAVAGFAGISAEARDATSNEHDMGFIQALKLYPKAVGWSMLLSTAIIMEGYDVVLLGSFYALPQFNEKYGVLADDGTYTVPAPWKSGLSNGALCGEILGLFINGIISEKYGYRKTMIASLAMMIAVIFIPFFSQNIQTLLAGEILCGIPWGVFQTLTTAYASEVCPVALRAYLCTYVNLCWVIGQFIASGVLRGVLSREDQWAYRIPFALQWMWPVPILIGVIFAPESPWWLVRNNRTEEAKKALLRLTTRGDPTFNADATIAMMTHTNEIEKQISEGTSYLDCFKGIDLRRTEVACITWLVQTLCGSTFMGYSTYFYQQAGLPTTSAFDLSMGQYALGMVGTVGSWFLMSRAGRRTIYLRGSIVLFVLLLIIGFTAIAPASNVPSRWAIGSMLLIFTFIYDLTVGPICYALVAEVSSTRLKAKTVVLARNLYNIGGIVVNILTTYQLTPTPTGWGWGAKSAFFWAGSCFLCIIWVYFRLPEPKGRTYAEMDVLFERGIAARDFRTTELDIFSGDHTTDSESDKGIEKSDVTVVENEKSGVPVAERL
ncbi:putative transporter (Major facilitator superfamily) [Venustampulla echinocandica]|uniref:Putative transporter (Major facilitator superfamily) n=1 Tax=Venustampulla echinocandica TaxID=2656787 RepID=A0A370U0S2_9HELO|nr:putative transporter (Major facilitator superfamily) [Venustampulla echinocandica]RDL41367.1 putative transporter (Major facilitator superfamily) [Venustampulla echinocandica]